MRIKIYAAIEYWIRVLSTKIFNDDLSSGLRL